MLTTMITPKRSRIEVSILDEHIYNLIKSNSGKRLTHEQISVMLGCHKGTVARSTKRLEAAGRIVRKWTGGRAASYYEVVHGDN